MTIAEALKFGTIITADAEETPLPLEHTDVVAHVTGPIASVSVTQRFGNPFDHPVELQYLFPLPHEAAITGFEFRVGSRVIKSKVEETAKARQTYEEARDSGKRAGLVEQRRPNLFSIELANVQPHETIIATIRYHERVRFDDGDYRFVFPMGITPKYHHDAGEAERTDAPVASTGSAIGTVDLQVAIDAGVALGDPVSPSHAISVSRLDERRVNVRSAGEIIPNKDFVVRYRVAEDDIRAAAWMANAKGGAAVLITAIPPRLRGDAEPAPREFVFVIDRSGSMGGAPIKQAKNALRACLRSLAPSDTFAIVAFDNIIDWYKKKAAPVTQEEVTSADRWISGLSARGGTEIIGAVKEALALPADKKRQRYIVFLTDGAVSAEKEVLSAIRKEIGSGRMFTFGIGPSVNRALLAGMASSGKGTAEFLQANEDIEEALIRFQDRVAYPALQDLHADWKDATAWDIYPSQLPDLYHGQPLELVARVKPADEKNGALIVTGQRGDEKWRTEIALPNATDDPAIVRVWAKARADELLDRIAVTGGDTAELRSEVISLAIEHHLITRYTSLVAVDEETTSGGEAKRVRVSVPMPEGVEMEGVGAAPAAFMAMTLSAPMPGRAPSAPVPVASSAPKRSGMFNWASTPFRTRAAAPAQMPAPLSDDDTLSGDDDPLRKLARTQNVSGSWGSGDEEVIRTAEAILEFVKQGHTTRSGHYRRQLAKAMKWLLAAKASGEAAAMREKAIDAMRAAEGTS